MSKSPEYPDKKSTFENLGTLDTSLRWKKDLIKGDCSNVHKEKIALENRKRTVILKSLWMSTR